MHVGFGELKLSSEHFWSLTPRELFAALTPPNSPSGLPPARADLARLMRAFPDTKGDDHGSTVRYMVD